MDRVPAEILDRIFIQLHLEQKIECMLVCRKWRQVIRTLDLLHTIVLPSNDFYSNDGLRRFSSLVSAVQTCPSDGVQVERLVLDRCLNEKLDAMLLPTCFPRLRFLCLNQARMPSALDLKSGGFEPWQSSLETIVDISSTLFVPCMLTTGIFSRLTSISLFQYYGSHFLELNKIIDGLRNAPALTKLKLGHFYYYFHHFDMIHQTAPLLKSLSVSGVLLNDDSLFNMSSLDIFSSTIHDASLDGIAQNGFLETLCIEGDAYLLNQYVWMRYLSTKYTHLSNFTFNCNIPSHESDQDDTRHQRYFEFIMPLFARLGSQLKSLKYTNHQLTPDLYRLLDQPGFEFKSLQLNVGASLIQAMAASHQARFLEHLSLCLDIVNMEELKPLKMLAPLKSLALYFRKDKYSKKTAISLNNLLSEHCPDGIASLSLDNAILTIDDAGSHCSPLKEIKMMACDITKEALTFITQCCPHLHSLSVLVCLPERFSMDLSFHRLLYVNIETNDRAIFKINTLENNKRNVYKRSCHQPNFISHLQDCYGKHDWPIYATRKSDQDTFNSLIDIHFTCKSIHTLFLNKRLALQ
jgi:hypothetical protein